MYKYDQRGVSATKDEVHKAIEHLDKGLYEKAFCKILPDFTGQDEAYCNLMHADTAGTKTSLAYMYWRETGDLSVWEGIAQDAIVMNLDDMACVGCTDDILLSSTIGRNRNLITGDVIATLINATVSFADTMRTFGVQLHLAGGETADVGDIVRTIDVGYTAYARMKRNKLIVNDIKAGDVIVGFASYGKTTYEKHYNGGMGSNGLTSARHDVFHHDYATKYPDAFDPNTPKAVVFNGTKRLTDTVEINGEQISIGKLVLSPTRTFLPLLKPILAAFHSNINGMIHCTGGGQAKVLKFINQKRIIKDNLFDVPPLFQMIQEEAQTSWKEMYQVFNMGNRLEIYTDLQSAEQMIAMAKQFNIDAQIIGYVEDAAQNEVVLKTKSGEYRYQ
jgi:phosphoribosylformylglycinamidine cyclo-ligase